MKPAIEAVKQFRADNEESLSAQDRGTLDEIRRRLERLATACSQLVKINNDRMEKRGIQVHLDPATDEVTFRHGAGEIRVKLNRADPKVRPSMRSLGAGEAYVAGAEHTEGVGPDSFELDFEGLLEEYYNNAHRILKLVKSLAGFKNFRCPEITMVRNKLVEHPTQGEAYSFGSGSAGPVVRPFHAPGREWIDAGLVPNTEAFVNRIVQAFEANPGVP